MKIANVLRHRRAAQLAALVVIGAVAAFISVTASANGRALDGAFCRTSTNSTLCLSLTWDGVAYGTNNRAELALRPGTYWITVKDDSVAHNFTLRSCPGATEPCGPGDGTAEDVTTVPDAPGEVTVKMELVHGTYRLFCSRPGHESGGMFVDFAVGGVGQVG